LWAAKASMRIDERALRVHSLAAQTMAPRYTFARAGPRDLPLLVVHRHRMFSDLGNRTEASIRSHDRRYRVWARARLRSRDLLGVIARDERGRAVASGCIWFREEQPRPETSALRSAYILSMYTLPRARKQGLASEVARRLVSIARELGYGRVMLHASAMGRGVYARLGFDPTNEMRVVFAEKGSTHGGRGQPRRRPATLTRGRSRRPRAPSRDERPGRTTRAGRASPSGRLARARARRTAA